MRRRVSVGKPFDLKARVEKSAPRTKKRRGKSKGVQVGLPIEGKVTMHIEWLDAITRTKIVWFSLLLSAGFLVGAALMGLCVGNFDALGKLWSVLEPIYALAAGYYFRKHRERKAEV